MPLAISYVRFSSKKQEEGDSVRRQRDMAVKWLEKFNAIGVTSGIAG